MGLISLLTDFGIQDEYAGVMKAVIWGIAPRSQIVDISHQVAPQDIRQAAFLLGAATPYFSAGSIHVIVVDPGVGSQRRIVAMGFKGHSYIAPDNGLLTLILNGQKPETLVEVNRPAFFLSGVSRTFHGRDIFAPVAGHIASGTMLQELGTPLLPDQLRHLSPPPAPVTRARQIEGTIVQVDGFGNLTSNIGPRQFENADAPADRDGVSIRVGGRTIRGMSACYADVPAGSPLALMGSRDLLEIAVNQGNARRYFGVERGQSVVVVW